MEGGGEHSWGWGELSRCVRTSTCTRTNACPATGAHVSITEHQDVCKAIWFCLGYYIFSYPNWIIVIFAQQHEGMYCFKLTLSLKENVYVWHRKTENGFSSVTPVTIQPNLLKDSVALQEHSAEEKGRQSFRAESGVGDGGQVSVRLGHETSHLFMCSYPKENAVVVSLLRSFISSSQ